MLRVELIVATAADDTGLRGSGLIVVNPPWTLHDETQGPAAGAARHALPRCDAKRDHARLDRGLNCRAERASPLSTRPQYVYPMTCWLKTFRLHWGDRRSD